MADSYGARLLSDVLGIAGDYVRTGVRVTVRSNLLPAIPVYSGSAAGSGGDGAGGSGGGGGRSVAEVLGIKAGVVVTDANGKVLASYGNPAPIDPLRAGVLALIVVGIAYVFVRGLIR